MVEVMILRAHICEYIVVILMGLLARGTPYLNYEYKDGYTNCSTNESLPIVYSGISLNQYRESQNKYNSKNDDYYTCDLGDDPYCDSWWPESDWINTNSIEGGMTEVLIDERWEELKVYELKNRHNHRSTNYTELVSLDVENFQVPISWKISKDAEIVFCSKPNIEDIFCVTATFSDGVKIRDPLGRTTFDSNDSSLLDNKWRTFIWFMQDGKSGFAGHSGDPNWKLELTKPIFKLPSFDPPIKHLFGRSAATNNFVKIHNYNFLRTRKNGIHQIGRPFAMKQGNLCITMYVAMCKTCGMIFMMAGQQIGKVELAAEGSWKNIEMEITGSRNSYEQLYVITVGNKYFNENYNYWAIDFMRLCSDVRFSILQGNHSCENPYPGLRNRIKETWTTSLQHTWRDGDMETVFLDSLERSIITSFDNRNISFLRMSTNGSEDVKFTAECIPYDRYGGYGRNGRYGRTYLSGLQNLERCSIWPNFQCGSFTVKQASYFPQRICDCYLRFIENDGLHSSWRFDFRRASEHSKVSFAPFNVEYSDEPNNNNIHIKWSHPYINNGPLKSFQISMTTASHIQKKLKRFSLDWDIKQPNSTYTVTIDNYKYDSCTEYFIQIRAVNEHGLGYAATELFESPPFLPTITVNYDKQESNAVRFSIRAIHNTCRDVHDKNSSQYVLILLSEIEGNRSISQAIMQLEKKIGKKFNSSYSLIAEYNIKYTKNVSEVEFVLGDTKTTKSEYLEHLQLTNNPVNKMEARHLIFLEVMVYGSKTKYYEHKFYLKNENERVWIGWSLSVVLFIGILLIIICCFCLIRRKYIRGKKRKISQMVRPPTSDNIYFFSDRVKLLDTTLLKSMKTVEEDLITMDEISLKPSDGSLVDNYDSRPVKIADFEKYVKMSISCQDLRRQFDGLPVNFTKPCVNGQLECSKPKNRFNNIVPYDYNRVKLHVARNEDGKDYINANYIRGFKRNKSYIAAQGPKSLTINDFWLMVWQENVRNIVMVVNLEESGVKKVEKYWPSYNEDFQFGKVHVYYHSSETLVDYEIRVFRVVVDGSERKVYQYHYLSWPDKAVPNSFQSFVPFMRRTLEIQSKSPILVHCCSGSAATGVFILCHICLQMAHDNGTVDVLKVTQQLRDQRVNMIHNITQYKFAHLLILECLFGLQAVISCNDDIDKLLAKLTGLEELKLQMIYMEDFAWQDRALTDGSNYEEIFTVYPQKNKVPDIIPDAEGAIELEKYPTTDESSCYINAVRVDGYQCSQKYIVTQQPMPNTMNDFWRMIVQQQVEAIISLNDINLKDKKSCTFWPTVDNPVMSPVDFIIIEHYSTVVDEMYELITVQVLVQGRMKKSMKVCIVSLKGWKPHVTLPDNIQSFLKFCGLADSITRPLQRTVVTCYDGCLASGIYVATSYLIGMIKLQKSFDVCSTVRAIRRNRQQFITVEKQLAFLYEVSATYIRGYQDYANFAASTQVFYNIYDYIE